jgi:hypothetical protein
MIRLRRDHVYIFREIGIWFQRRGSLRASLAKVTHITSHKKKLLYPFEQLFDPKQGKG